MKPKVDIVDQRILTELGHDGRQSASALAKKLGISHALANKRIRRLLDSKIARIAVYTNPVALGYTNLALVGIKVVHPELGPVADKLCGHHSVILELVGIGWQDILIWALFRDQSDLHDFVYRHLGAVSGISAVEVLTVVESLNIYPRLYARWPMPISKPEYRASGGGNNGLGRVPVRAQTKTGVVAQNIDEIDVRILRQIEQDGRQPVISLAKKIGVDRGVASKRLKKLLNDQSVRIAGTTGPDVIETAGSRYFASLALSVSPNEVGAVFDRAKDLPSVAWLARTLGHHNLVIAVASEPEDLRNLLERQLVRMSGIFSVETMVSLQVRKNAYEHFATLSMDSLLNRQQKEDMGPVP